MAFNGVGLFFIGAGVTFRVAFTFGFPPNGDRGAQCFSAHPLTTTARLVRVSQDKTLGTNGIFVYGFTVANAGPAAAFFNVQGGGYI
jgi:hypothetical protein